MDIDLNVGFDVECATCGATVKATMNRNQDTLSVEPCEGCLQDKYNEGYDDAEKEAE